MAHAWHDIPVGDDAPETVTAVIEIPQGGKVKYELEKQSGLLYVDRGPLSAALEFDRLTHTTPEKAAQLILGAVRKNKRRALIGPDAHVFDLAARCSPRAAQWAIGRLAARRAEALR